MDFNLVDSVLRHLNDECFFCYFKDGSWSIRSTQDPLSVALHMGHSEQELRDLLISLREKK